jgi:hypothetical protein
MSGVAQERFVVDVPDALVEDVRAFFRPLRG